jgi:hypothetical protein
MCPGMEEQESYKWLTDDEIEVEIMHEIEYALNNDEQIIIVE